MRYQNPYYRQRYPRPYRPYRSYSPRRSPYGMRRRYYR